MTWSNRPDQCVYESFGELDETWILIGRSVWGLRVCIADMVLKPHFEEPPNVCQEVR